MNGYLTMLDFNALFLIFGREPTDAELDRIEREGEQEN